MKQLPHKEGSTKTPTVKETVMTHPSKLPRIPKQMRELETELSYLLYTDLEQIYAASRTLTLNDCYDLIGLDPSEIPERDKLFAEAAHRKGRAYAIQYAGNQLFVQMVGKSALQASLEYLKTMSGTFTAEVETPVGGKGGFSFNVNLAEGDTKNQDTSSTNLKAIK